jgi:hypothetical protein
MPKDKVKAKQPTLEPKQGERATLGGMLGPLGLLLGAMPAQVRLSSREQQPRPIVPPKAKRGTGR